VTRGAAMAVAAAMLLALVGACGPEEPIRDVRSVTRGGRTVTMVDCPKCEMCARIAQDAMTATVNVSRLSDGNPDAREFARRRDAIVARVFATMESVAAAGGGAPWGDDAAVRWLAKGATPRVVRSDGAEAVFARGSGAAREVFVRNRTDLPREIVVPFASVGLSGCVAILDLTERAIPPDGEGSLHAFVPARGERLFRLVAGGTTTEEGNGK